jgi:hypothetical protein
MSKKRKSVKSDSPLSKDIESSTQEKTSYDADEASYVNRKSKKKVQQKKKREGYEILDGITHKVSVEYGERSKQQPSDVPLKRKSGKDKKNVQYISILILQLLVERKEQNDYSDEVLTNYHTDPKSLKKNAPMMVCRGMNRQSITNSLKEKDYSFTTNRGYVNTAITYLQDQGFVDTFREKPKARTMFDFKEASDTIQKLGKKTRRSYAEQLMLDRAKIIASKKNEDIHHLNYYLTTSGGQEIAEFRKEVGGSKSHFMRALMHDYNDLASSSTADTEE